MLRELFEDILRSDASRIDPAPEGLSREDLGALRDQIDRIDRGILAMLNERALCANRIGRIKKQLSMPVYMPAREQEVLDNVTKANQGPLSDAAVRRLYERIIDETRSLERQMVQED